MTATAATPLHTPILSDRQNAVLEAVSLGGAYCLTPLLETTGAVSGTIQSLARLGLLDVRCAGAREPLVHLTESGRVLWGALQEEPENGSSLTDRKENTMTTTETDAPPVEDVTGKPNEAAPKKADLQPLFKTLLAEAKKASGRGATVEAKAVYTRVSQHGKAVVYLNNPTSKNVRVEVPQNDGTGYDVIKAAGDADVPKVLELVKARVDHLATKKAEKTSK